MKAALLTEAGLTDTRPYAYCSPEETLRRILENLGERLTDRTIERAAADIEVAAATGRALGRFLDTKAAEGLIDRKSGAVRTIITPEHAQAAMGRMNALSPDSPTYIHDLVFAAFPELEHNYKQPLSELLMKLRDSYHLSFSAIAGQFGNSPAGTGRQHYLTESRIKNRLYGSTAIDADFTKQFIEAVHRCCALQQDTQSAGERSL